MLTKSPCENYGVDSGGQPDTATCWPGAVSARYVHSWVEEVSGFTKSGLPGSYDRSDSRPGGLGLGTTGKIADVTMNLQQEGGLVTGMLEDDIIMQMCR